MSSPMITISLFLCAFVSLYSSTSYSGYQVFRVSTNDTETLNRLLTLSDSHLLDVWSVQASHVDVMVCPKQAKLPFWNSFTYSVIHEDVEAIVSHNLKQNREAQLASRKSNNLFGFDHFPRYAEVRTYINEMVAKHSDASLVQIGKTYGNQDIFAISIGDPSAKKVFYIHCTIHAREWISTTTCLWIVDQLLNTDPDRVKLTKAFRWIIVPIHNADGYEYSHTSSRLWRKNRQPVNGNSCIGTDINRNYDFAFGKDGASNNPCSETYHGPKAFSTPEALAEQKFLAPFMSNGTVAAYIDIHSYGGWFLSAWGYTLREFPKEYAEMERQMKAGVAAIKTVNNRGYVYGPSGRTLYVTSGSTVDYIYGTGNVVNSYTIECYGNSFTPPPSQIAPTGQEVWLGVKSVALGIQA